MANRKKPETFSRIFLKLSQYLLKVGHLALQKNHSWFSVLNAFHKVTSASYLVLIMWQFCKLKRKLVDNEAGLME